MHTEIVCTYIFIFYILHSMLFFPQDVSRQKNSSDCGMQGSEGYFLTNTTCYMRYVIQFAERLMKGKGLHFEVSARSTNRRPIT